MDSVPNSPNISPQENQPTGMEQPVHNPPTPETIPPDVEKLSPEIIKEGQSSGPPQDDAASQPLILPQVIQQGVPGQTADPGKTQANDPVVADDVDVIEKEWVDRAKQIINATADDPHRQETEINRLHQAYLQKRYGKTLKMPPESQ